MALRTQPLRDEHKELFPHIEALRVAADSVGDVTPQKLSRLVDAAYDFLAHHLIPHATAEDKALYPVVARVMGAAGATATMSRDHVEVGRLTEQLAKQRAELAGIKLTDARAKELKGILYGLYALVKVHFAKEEEIYLPLLDKHLSVTQARELFEHMEQEAAKVKKRGSGGRKRR